MNCKVLLNGVVWWHTTFFCGERNVVTTNHSYSEKTKLWHCIQGGFTWTWSSWSFIYTLSNHNNHNYVPFPKGYKAVQGENEVWIMGPNPQHTVMVCKVLCGAISCQASQVHRGEPLFFSINALDSCTCVCTTHETNGCTSHPKDEAMAKCLLLTQVSRLGIRTHTLPMCNLHFVYVFTILDLVSLLCVHQSIEEGNSEHGGGYLHNQGHTFHSARLHGQTLFKVVK